MSIVSTPRAWRVAFVLLASAAGGVSCTDCGGTPDPPPPSTTDAQAICEIALSGEAIFAQSLLSAYTRPTRCAARDVVAVPSLDDSARAQIADTCATDAGRAEFETALAGGRVRLNTAAIRACSALDSTVLVGPDAVLPATCEADALFVGLVGSEGACEQDWDCAAGLSCEHDDPASDVKACLAPASIGDACATASGGPPVRSCATGAFCDNGLCAALAQLGETCADASTCADGLLCAGGTCAARHPLGAACTAAADCLTDGAVCNLAGVCALPVADGALCDAAADVCAQPCSVCRPDAALSDTLRCLDRAAPDAGCVGDTACHAGFVCDIGSGACVLGGDVDAPCLDDETCRAGLGCNGAAVCKPIGAPGGACDVDVGCSTGACVLGTCEGGEPGDRCASDLDCNDLEVGCIDAQCAPLPTTGACTVDGSCAAGFACVDAACVALPAAGAPCLPPNDECAPGAFCAEGTCAEMKATGGTCTADVECTGGSCQNGTCIAAPGSCRSSKTFFPLYVILSAAFPLRRRLRKTNG